MRICPLALQESLDSDLVDSIGHPAVDTAGDASFLRSTDPRVVAGYHIQRSLLKKYVGDRSKKKQADKKAFDLFLEWNQRCEAWSEPIAENESDAELLGEFRKCFMQCFETPYGEVIDFPSTVPQFFRVGPGAAVGAMLGDAYTKMYAGEMSTTSDELYWLYYDSTLPFERENLAENLRQINFATTVVQGSNLGFADKNASISRTRTTEPNLNMIYQLGTGAVLEAVLSSRFGINLATQPDCNRELSRRGSLDGSVSTTDLSSASDATAIKFLHWALPYPEVTKWLRLIRSDCTRNPFKKDEWIKLHILSSMGNGFTFPLMTLIFSCVVEAVYKCLDIKLVRNKVVRLSHLEGDTRTVPGNFGVFGDDIIVDSRAYQTVNHLLEMLGYAVNRDKSFGPATDGSDGVFRESCGTDWFLGHNVRGVYCKLLDTPQRRYTLINRLNAWSANWAIPLPRTISLLLKSVWYLPVPPWEAADSGVIVPLGLFRVGKRDEYGGFIYSAMRPVKLTWDPAKGLTGAHKLKGGSLKPLGQDIEWYDDTGKSTYKPFINLDGLLLSAVTGLYRSDVGIGVRSGTEGPRYKKTTLSTPGWAYTRWSSAGFTPTGWATFEKTIAQLNIGRKVDVEPLIT